MHERVEKPKENKSKAIANSVTQKKSNGYSIFNFSDNRTETIAQRKLLSLTYNTSQPNQTIQLLLNSQQHQQLKKEKERFEMLRIEYQEYKETISNNLILYEQNLSKEEMIDASFLREDVEQAFISYDQFFQDTNTKSKQAMNSQGVFKNFVAALNGYEFSGGKNKLLNLFRKTKKLSTDKTKKVLRTVPVEVDDSDERFFFYYLKRNRPPLTVYRGDGRGITVDSLDNISFSNIEPGGTRDISFFGMVEHQHSNSAKNGMVSTTSSFEVAHFWATQKQKYGIVYEMVVDNYLHVANLLGARNFKDRYPDQFEILVPGVIPANKIVSATLYEKSKVIKRVKK